MLFLYVGEYGEGLDIVYFYEDRVIVDGGIIEVLGCVNIGWVMFCILLDDGSKFDYVVLELVVYTGVEVEDRIKFIFLGVVNFKNWLVGKGSSFDVVNSDWYKIQFLDIFENVIDECKFYFICEVKYIFIQLVYIFKYGIWNYVIFFKCSEEIIDVIL